MDVILRMLLHEMFYSDSDVSEIRTVDDLCDAFVRERDVAKLFAAMNDDNDGYSTDEILKIANEVYQEEKNND